MLLSFIHYHFSLLFFISFIVAQPCYATSTLRKLASKPTTLSIKTLKLHSKFHNFQNFLNAEKGSHINGIKNLKQYFHHFGYLHLPHTNNITNLFDTQLESAVMTYQAQFHLPTTGKLDLDTLSLISTPRCGVADVFHTLHYSQNYVFFPGKPRWARGIPITLTYAFSTENVIRQLTLSDIRKVFKSAFARWESVIPVKFRETRDYGFADIKIGFYHGDHGDGEPFDGVLGVLAHAFSPQSGKFHLDAAEKWAVDFESEKSEVAVDLESVVTHEIGHLLGLGHSFVKEAVMYPSLKPREKKVELKFDDIKGVQGLYGSNPNFTFGSLLESDTSANEGVDLGIRSSWWNNFTFVMLLCFLI